MIREMRRADDKQNKRELNLSQPYKNHFSGPPQQGPPGYPPGAPMPPEAVAYYQQQQQAAAAAMYGQLPGSFPPPGAFPPGYHHRIPSGVTPMRAPQPQPHMGPPVSADTRKGGLWNTIQTSSSEGERDQAQQLQVPPQSSQPATPASQAGPASVQPATPQTSQV